MKTFLLIAHDEKEKAGRIALNETANTEEIGELESKKSLSKDILVFFFKGDLDSDHLQKTTRALVSRLDFQGLLSSLQR